MLYFTGLDGVPIEWHVGEKPPPISSINMNVPIFADGDELDFVAGALAKYFSRGNGVLFGAKTFATVIYISATARYNERETNGDE